MADPDLIPDRFVRDLDGLSGPSVLGKDAPEYKLGTRVNRALSRAQAALDAVEDLEPGEPTDPVSEAITVWMWGNASPDDARGHEGDKYADTTADAVFTKTDGAWVEDAGVGLVIGTGVPAGGSDGDFFSDGASGRVYGPKDGTWPEDAGGAFTRKAMSFVDFDRDETSILNGGVVRRSSVSFIPPRSCRYQVAWYVVSTDGNTNGDFIRLTVRQDPTALATGGTSLDGDHDHGSGYGSARGNSGLRGPQVGDVETPTILAAGTTYLFTIDANSIGDGTVDQSLLRLTEVL